MTPPVLKLNPAPDWGGVWPNESQQLLLQAALLDAPAAQQAWARWQEKADLNAIDSASWKLIPLAYVNLKRLDVADPLLAQAKALHFSHWRSNQVLFQQSASFLDLMQQWQVPVLILKGVALAHLYYPDTGSRPMADLDVLVPADRFRSVCERLLQEGWQTTLKELELFELEDEPSFGLMRADGLRVDIHGHVLHANCTRGADDQFWTHAQSWTLKERPALTLGVEDQLLHVISHGVRWCDVPPFRWIADAWWILRSSSSAFDWDYFVRQTEFHQVNLEIFYGLQLLNDLLSIQLPSGLLDRLEAIPSSGDVHVQYVFNTSTVPVSGLPRALAIWKGSGRAAPVYRIDGKTPRAHGHPLSISELRRVLALLDYALKALFRITVRFFRPSVSTSKQSHVTSPTSPPN